MKFEDYALAPEIKKNLETLGWKRPTDIQFKSIPPILKGEDVLAIAQTGTGKTAAFAIPIVHLIHSRKNSARAEGIQCLVMEPTRELALQITEVFREIARHTRATVASVFGGVDQDPQIARLEKGTDILVATPGRMFDLVSQGHLKLDRLEVLILDEADHMLDLGFIDDIRDLMRHIPKRRQTLFFSATIDEKIKKLAYSLVHNPIRIQISPKNPVSKNVEHAVAFIEMDDKRFFLERIVQQNEGKKILVFVRTKVRAERVKAAMARVAVDAETIHGDKEQQDRLDVLARFRTGELHLLIATDITARGIDIPGVDIVVNYDLPDLPEHYVHRVGRTGRGDRKGQAISFCSAEEKPLLKEIEEYVGTPLQVVQISRDEYNETIQLSEDVTDKWRDVMKEIEEAEKWMKKKKK